MGEDLRIDIAFAQIEKLQSDLRRIQTGVDASMGQVGRSVGRARGAFSRLGQEVPILGQAFRVLTNPIVAVVGSLALLGTGFTNAVQVARVFEKQISDTAAIVTAGLNTEEARTQLAALEAEALRLGNSTEFSATQAAQAFEFLGRAGFSTAQILDSAEDTLALATVGNLSLARSADIASNVLSQFNLEANQLGSVVDVIAKTTTTANTNVEQFADAMNFLGPTAAALGIDIEEASAAIGILGNSGLQGSLATRALGTSLVRLADPTKKAADEIESIGLRAFDAEGNFVGLAGLIGQLETAYGGYTQEQTQASLATLFGAEAIQEFNILLSAGSEELAAYTGRIKEASAQNGGFAQGIRDAKLDNFEGAVISLQSAFEGFQLALSGGSLPVLKEFTFALADGVRFLTAWLDGSVSLADQFGPLGAAVDGALSRVQSFAVTVGELITGQTNLVAALGPVGLALVNIGQAASNLIGAISGLIPAGDAASGIFSQIGEIASGVLAFALQQVAVILFAVADSAGIIVGALQRLGGTLAEVLSPLLNLEGAAGGLGDVLTVILVGAVDLLADAIRGVAVTVDLFATGLAATATFVRDNADVIGLLTVAIVAFNAQLIASRAALIASQVATQAVAAAQLVWAGIQAGLAGGIGLVTAAQYALNLALSLNPIGLVVAAVAALVAGFVLLYRNSETVRAGLAGFFNSLKQLATNILSGIIDQFGGLADIIAGVFTLDFDRVKSGFERTAEGLKQLTSRIGEGVGEAFTAGYSDKINAEAAETAAAAASASAGAGRAAGEAVGRSIQSGAGAAIAGATLGQRLVEDVEAGANGAAEAGANIAAAIQSKLGKVDGTPAGQKFGQDLIAAVNAAVQSGSLTAEAAAGLTAQINERLASVSAAANITPTVNSEEAIRGLEEIQVSGAATLGGLQDNLQDLNTLLKETDPNLPLFEQIIDEIVNTEGKLDELKAKIEVIKQDVGSISAINVPELQPPSLANTNLTGPVDVAAVTPSPLTEEAVAQTQTFAAQIAEALGLSSSAAAKLEEDFQGMKEAINETLAGGAVKAVETFGKTLGENFGKAGAGLAAFQAFAQAALQTILVDVPKLIGIGLIRTALPGLPVTLPLFLAGIALVGLSGLAGGLLSRIGGGVGAPEPVAAPPPPSTVRQPRATAPDQTGGSSFASQGIGANAAGADRQNITNVTLEINTDGIVDVLERQRIVNGELTNGR